VEASQFCLCFYDISFDYILELFRQCGIFSNVSVVLQNSQSFQRVLKISRSGKSFTCMKTFLCFVCSSHEQLAQVLSLRGRLTIACLNLMDLAEVRARGHNSSV
jgi:hypothetical protein